MKLLKHSLDEMTKCDSCDYFTCELYSLEGEEKKICNDCMLNRLTKFEIIGGN